MQEARKNHVLHVNDETYLKNLAEEEEYQRLQSLNLHKTMALHLRIRAWASGVASAALMVAGSNPRFRPLLFAGMAAAPYFVWQLVCLIHGERHIQRRVKARLEEDRLAALEERRQVRMNIIEQKQAQDEIERLKAEIEVMKKGAGES